MIKNNVYISYKLKLELSKVDVLFGMGWDLCDVRHKPIYEVSVVVTPIIVPRSEPILKQQCRFALPLESNINFNIYLD